MAQHKNPKWLSIQRSRKISTCLRKTFSRCQHWDATDVGIIDIDYKTADTKMSHEVRVSTLEEDGKIESPSKYIEAIKKNQKESLELKNVINFKKQQQLTGWAQ